MKKSLGVFLSLALLLVFVPTAWAAKEAKIIIEPQYEDIAPFYEDLAFVQKDELWGVIDKQGKQIITPKYDSLYNEYYRYKEGLARVSKGWTWGFVDKQGEEIIPLQYDWVSDFNEGLAIVLLDEKFGFINKQGQIIIQPVYDNVTIFENGVAIVIEDYETGTISLIDKTGRKIANTPYYSESSLDEDIVFKDGVYWVSDSNGKLGAIDHTGKLIIDLKYDYPSDVMIGHDTYIFNEGVAIVGANLQRSIINTKGVELARLTKYDGNPNFTAGTFSEGLAGICVDNKWGFIDLTGKEVIEPKYDSVYYFNEGLAVVYVDGKFGYVDKTGKEIVKPQYEDASHLLNGRAAVRKDGKWGFIDASGKEVVKPQYDDWYLNYNTAYWFSEDLAFVRKGEYFGYIDKDGKEVIPLKYDNAWYFEEGMAAVNVNEKWGVIAKPVDEPSSWAKTEVEAAAALGLVPLDMQSGYEDDITRADFSKLVMNLLEVKQGKTIDELLEFYGKTVDASAFKDTQDAMILAANALGIVGGKGNGLFDPDGSITRQEAAAMLTRAATLFELKAGSSAGLFADDKTIAAWGKEAVAFVSSVKDKTNEAFIMGGTGNNKFSPTGTYTRQQAFITMKRLFNAL